MHRISFFFLFCLFTTALLGQDATKKAPLSMSDAILKEWRDFYPENLSSAQWIPGSNSFTHVANNKIVRVNAESLEADSIDMLPIWREKLIAISGDTIENLPSFKHLEDGYAIQSGSAYYKSDATGNLKQVNKLPEKAANIDVETTSNNVAFTKDGGLFVASEGRVYPIVASEKDGIVYGEAVHRQEFGIYKGTFWSADGQKLAFYRMDESMVTQYPIYNLDDMPASVKNIRYPFAGATSHHVTVGVFDVKTQKVLYLKTGEPAEQYLTNVEWTPDGSGIIIAVLNRAQNHMKLNLYDANSGEFVKTLFEEKEDTWMEPEHPVVFVPGSNDKFIWQSERDGFMHLYLYDMTGKMIRRLSEGKFPVTDFVGFDKKGEVCFWEAADESGLERHYFASEIRTGRQKKLTTTKGTHKLSFNEAGTYALDNFQSSTTARRIHVLSISKARNEKTYFEAKNPYENVQLGDSRIVSFPSKSGFALYGRVILPPNFDENKQYPAIQYVYNGPHVQLVRNTWMDAANLWMHRLAQQGFVVFSMDGRGSGNRGFAFENAIHAQCGTVEVEDQLSGAAYLKALPYIDGDRVGIYGWSYGGFMATSLLTRPEAAGVFACGVAGGAVTDWSMYEIMYTERYMDSPQENPEGYKNASLFSYIDNLNAPLLMIHGTADDVVLWQHTLRYVREAVKKGKQLEYFPYPDHLHNVRGKDRVHLFDKIEDFFLRELAVK